MTDEIVYVLFILIILVIVSEYGIEGVVKAIVAGIFIVLAARLLGKGQSIEGFMEKVVPADVNSTTVIPPIKKEFKRDMTHERALALSNLFGPAVVDESTKTPSLAAQKYYAMAEGEYGRDHQYMDMDTDLAFMDEAKRRGRQITNQAANMVKATADTWRDIYEPELREAESISYLRL